VGVEWGSSKPISYIGWKRYGHAMLLDLNTQHHKQINCKKCCCFFIWQDEQETKRRLASTDAKEIQRFYELYCRKNLEEGLNMKKP
jgi:hypothetical protein